MASAPFPASARLMLPCELPLVGEEDVLHLFLGDLKLIAIGDVLQLFARA
ncbi:hypothetical protein [Myxococcus landrumensis]|uniref:Uncharacterized protein n=1 Tax=Myxococcus landrumensis TaxID=2813577 RepID=A0ABX7N1V6_9BACT|nr:hypothetical protein [Myxococcus landrumus]QSQ11371.1 hypothetical protein JY572_23490 [Myxococcus landrumus]